MKISGLMIVIAVEQVNKFKFLGTWITIHGSGDTEIRTSIGMAKDVFSKKKQ